MFSVCAKFQEMVYDERLDEKRIRDLWEKLGHESILSLEQAIEAPQNHLKRYMDGKSRPNSTVLLRLSEVLGAPPSYLYGRDMDMVRKNVIDMVRKTLGQDEASVLEIYLDLTGEQRRTILTMLSSFAKQESPTSAFERDAKESGVKPAPAPRTSKKK